MERVLERLGQGVRVGMGDRSGASCFDQSVTEGLPYEQTVSELHAAQAEYEDGDGSQ